MEQNKKSEHNEKHVNHAAPQITVGFFFPPHNSLFLNSQLSQPYHEEL